MDKKSLTLAAEAAINDLQLDCKVSDVCRSPKRDEWCVELSGKYGQLCDEFKNQFGKENSFEVAREKIKSHLLKQVSKIRSSTGKSRKPRARLNDESQTRSSALNSPLKLIEEVFSRASEIAGDVVKQAVVVADAGRETVSNLAEGISPVTIEIRSASTTKAKMPRKSSRRKTSKAAQAIPKKAVRTTRKLSHRTRKQTKKAGKAAAKVSSKTKKKR